MSEFTINGNTFTATPERIRRIRQSIAECDRWIAIESPRSADLRPADIAQMLEQYIAHRAKLQAIIDAHG